MMTKDQEIQYLHEKCRLLTDANMRLKKRIVELEERERKLNSLEAGGVDNWDGYDFAMEFWDEAEL